MRQVVEPGLAPDEPRRQNHRGLAGEAQCSADQGPGRVWRVSFECGVCGKRHEDMSRAFMTKLPETVAGDTLEVREERKSMCRGDQRCFVRCEVQVPVAGRPNDSLAFIVWVEVEEADYRRIHEFRDSGEKEPFPEWVSGRLANAIVGIPDTFGAAVRFEVAQGDPTPYVKWVEPGGNLASRITTGASMEFWHDVVAFHRRG